MELKRCSKCVMPETRPGISFNDQGVCSACQSYEKRNSINWELRFEELKKICDKYRGMNGTSYDCAIAVSGGKDSHFQVHVFKELMGMNPILFTVEDNFTLTEAGKHNLRNISETFGCNLISIKPDIKTQKILMRKTFEKFGKPTWFIDRLIYTYPLLMAHKFNTPLLVYGENISYEYGGSNAIETYSAKDQIENGVASQMSVEFLTDDNVSEKDLSLLIPPNNEQLNYLDPVYLSYFVQWNSYKNYLFAKSRGFHDLTHEWIRSHHIENFDQVDSMAYLVHPWLKYPKFGHATATDYASRLIRYGLLNRKDAVTLVKDRDHKLDPRCVQDFCDFLGYTETDFWAIVEKLYNPELFVKDSFGQWVLKEPIWNQCS